MKRIKLDLHVHTRGSDGIGTPKQIATSAIEAGLDGICITDHHKTYTAEGLKVAEACRAVGLLVIHGCEYSTAQGHLLVYGVNIEDLGLGYYPEMQAVIDEVNRRGGVCVPAHPYKGYQRCLKDRVKRLRGVRAYEVANGQCTYQCPENNKYALTASKSKRKLGTGGSDAHSAQDIGLTYTEFDGEITCEREFLNVLRRGKYRAKMSRKRVQTRQRQYKLWSEQLEAKKTCGSPASKTCRRTLGLDIGKDSRQIHKNDSYRSPKTSLIIH